MSDFRDLSVYKKAFENAMLVFEMVKKFPTEEKYGLSSQIRKSSRSVCSCLGEGYRKRKYINHFVAKVSDSDMENSESIVWLNFALACKYIVQAEHNNMVNRFEEVGKMLNHIMDNPEKYI